MRIIFSAKYLFDRQRLHRKHQYLLFIGIDPSWQSPVAHLTPFLPLCMLGPSPGVPGLPAKEDDLSTALLEELIQNSQSPGPIAFLVKAYNLMPSAFCCYA